MEQKCDRSKEEPNPVKCLSFSQFYHLFGCLNFSIIGMGIILVAIGMFFLIVSIFGTNECLNVIYSRLFLGYCGATLTLSGSTFYMLEKHKRRTDLKTAEYEEDVESLVTEIEKEIYGKNRSRFRFRDFS